VHDMVREGLMSPQDAIASSDPEIHYKGESLTGYDAVIPRIGASVTFFGTAVLRQFEMMGVYPANESVGISRSRDKLRSMQLLSREGIGLPVTVFAHRTSDPAEVLKLAGGAPVVIKLLEGTQGIGVVLGETPRSEQCPASAIIGFSLAAALRVRFHVVLEFICGLLMALTVEQRHGKSKLRFLGTRVLRRLGDQIPEPRDTFIDTTRLQQQVPQHKPDLLFQLRGLGLADGFLEGIDSPDAVCRAALAERGKSQPGLGSQIGPHIRITADCSVHARGIGGLPLLLQRIAHPVAALRYHARARGSRGKLRQNRTRIRRSPCFDETFAPIQQAGFEFRVLRIALHEQREIGCGPRRIPGAKSTECAKSHGPRHGFVRELLLLKIGQLPKRLFHLSELVVRQRAPEEERRFLPQFGIPGVIATEQADHLAVLALRIQRTREQQRRGPGLLIGQGLAVLPAEQWLQLFLRQVG